VILTYLADKLNPSTNVWDQDLYLNGDLVSSVSSGTLQEYRGNDHLSPEIAMTDKQ